MDKIKKCGSFSCNFDHSSPFRDLCYVKLLTFVPFMYLILYLLGSDLDFGVG